MRRAALSLLLMLAACRSEPTDKGAAPVASVAPARRPEFVTAGQGDVAALVRDELAKADGARVVVYVGATWCEPCRRFHDAATAGALDGQLPPIRFLEFDLDRDEARLKAAGYTSQYVPLFATPNGDGRASGKQIAGSVKGPGAPAEITPRLVAMLLQP